MYDKIHYKLKKKKKKKVEKKKKKYKQIVSKKKKKNECCILTNNYYIIYMIMCFFLLCGNHFVLEWNYFNHKIEEAWLLVTKVKLSDTFNHKVDSWFMF